ELGAAEHEGCLLEIVARVRPDRMDVTPGPLDGVVEEDAAAAAGFEKAIDGANAPISGLRGIPPITCPLGEGYLRPVADEEHRFGKVPEHATARRRHLASR